FFVAGPDETLPTFVFVGDEIALLVASIHPISASALLRVGFSHGAPSSAKAFEPRSELRLEERQRFFHAANSDAREALVHLAAQDGEIPSRLDGPQTFRSAADDASWLSA